MPRQRRSAASARSAPSRPSAAPARPNAAPQNRSMTTTAPATTRAQPPAKTQERGPGLFGQMASTAAGVAIGSSIGHAIGGFFGGGSGAPVEADQNQAVANPQDNSYQSNSWGPRSCEFDAKQFTECLDENGGNMQICGWYLEQLKACQAASSQY